MEINITAVFIKERSFMKFIIGSCQNVELIGVSDIFSM